MIVQSVVAMTLGGTLGGTMGVPWAGGSMSIQERAKDWRIGPVVYQVFVDRFAPPASLESKRAFIQAPRNLKNWSELPTSGKPLGDLGVWSHELDFWGGDLASLTGKLDYIKGLGSDIVYLQPVQQAFTNHKYDAQDYAEVSPEIGTRKELLQFFKTVHKQDMRVMLDGVFNHMGRTSPIFQSAQSDPTSKYRDWFFFDKKLPNGYRGWAGVANLPGLQLETKAVRDYLWNDKDSIVRKYLREGLDGWRLDVAFELGPTFLTELTEAAHKEKKGSAVVGEINGYPADWFPAVDGVFNFHLISVALEMMNGTMSGGQAGRALNDLVTDAGTENLLRSWLLLDNHDTPRIANRLPNLAQRQLARTLQFTLPGCPVIYYGSELGMTGSGDPQNRAPMRWDMVTDANPDLTITRRLIKLRKQLPALRYGNVKTLQTDKLFAFARLTGNIKEAVLVVANPTQKAVNETFPTRVGQLMSWGELEDALTGKRVRSHTGLMSLEVPANTVMVLTPVVDRPNGYSPYDRIGGR